MPEVIWTEKKWRKIVIEKREWQGVIALDIRLWVKIADEWHPTRKGIRVPLEMTDELVKALKEVLDA